MSSLKTFIRTAGVFVGLATFGVANATTAENLGGMVRVNQGRGYAPLHGAGPVQAGDSVMADLRGTGRIVYDDGCVVDVRPGSVVTVSDTSPCARPATAFEPSTGLVVAGGAAALGGVAAALAASGGGGGGSTFIPIPRPASP